MEQNLTRPTYYWVTAIGNDGRRILLGPTNTYSEAEQWGYEKLGLSFEVFPMNTKNKSEAGAQLRAIMLNRGSSIDSVMKRMHRRANKEGRIG